MTKEELTNIFKELGAPGPEGWAHSEITEGLPQLARFLFLKGCWDMIVEDGDTRWIDGRIANTPPSSNDPYAGSAHALRRLLACGASKDDINEVVRCAQAELLFDICYQMDDSTSVDGNDDYANWALMLLDEDDNPIKQIGGLHESVLHTDPTGREMRPRSTEPES
jgi:hypothetical protein